MELGLPELRELIRLLQEGGLTELSIESGDSKVRLRRDPGGVPSGLVSAPATLPLALAASPSVPAVGEPSLVVRSPMVGTFYRAPSPDAPPFVEEGSLVTQGQCLCIIEAMKLMNEIEAEQGGRISKVLVANGSLVEFGQPLFELAR